MSDQTLLDPVPSVPAPFHRAHEVDDLGELDPAWKGTRVEWADVAGTRTRLLRRGAEDGAPAGAPTVLCIHGLGGAATNFVEAKSPLARLGDVVSLDLPGFGECAPQPGTAPSPRNNARFVADAIDQLGLGPVVLVGNSMGGMISTLVAAERPDLVHSLVLLGPALPGHLPAVRISAVQARSFGPLLVPFVGPRMVRRRLDRMTWRERHLDTVGSIVADIEAVPERALALGTAGLAREAELRWRRRAFMEATSSLMAALRPPGTRAMLDAMRAVQAPTLFVRGAADPLVLRATTVMAQRLDLGWTIEEPDGIGHVPQLEAPEWLAGRIEKFLAA